MLTVVEDEQKASGAERIRQSLQRWASRLLADVDCHGDGFRYEERV